MKNSAHYAELLKKLCNRLRRQEEVSAEIPALDATTTLVLAILSEVTTESKALTVLTRIQHYFVDFNEMRVCGKDELMEVLGKNFPQARQRAEFIINILNQIYNKLDSLDLDVLHEGGKREAKAFLESLDNITPYVVYSVMMHSFGAHAFPVNDAIMQMLRQEEVISPDADIANVQGFLKRQTQASKIREVYAILRHHADMLSSSGTAGSHGNNENTNTSVKSKKTTTKKTTTKKTVNKKVTAKKAVSKDVTNDKVANEKLVQKKTATKTGKTASKKTTTKKSAAAKTTAVRAAIRATGDASAKNVSAKGTAKKTGSTKATTKTSSKKTATPKTDKPK